MNPSEGEEKEKKHKRRSSSSSADGEGAVTKEKSHRHRRSNSGSSSHKEHKSSKEDKAKKTEETETTTDEAPLTSNPDDSSKKKKKSKKTKELLAERDRRDREREQVTYAVDKAAQQRMVEEADFRNAQDMFGDLSTVGELDAFVPKSSMDFEKYSGMLCDRATCFATDAHYTDFVINICKNLAGPMKSEDVRKIIAALNTLVNEKIHAEKGGVVSVAQRHKKKVQEQRAKALALKQLDEEPDEEAEDEYSRYEDKYDFM